MSDPLFEFSVSDWTITLYIRNTLEMYLHTWVPLTFLGLIVLAGVSSKIKSKRKQPKPLLGVVPPKEFRG